MSENRMTSRLGRTLPLRVCVALLCPVLGGAVLAGDNAGSPNWPSFRGTNARGVDDSTVLPTQWNAADGVNINWKVPIPGLAHSSPIVWADRIFLTSAVSSQADAGFRHGQYGFEAMGGPDPGSGASSEDRSLHEWKVFCLEKQTGEILWERVSRTGEPVCKRHIKSTYANATPATDGRYVVVSFGCEGLYAYTLEGRLVWSRDLGPLRLGSYANPSSEWGPASSPIIFRDKVLLQIDAREDSHVIALNLENGETVWKTIRDELPSWGTPTVYEGPGAAELVTNGSTFIRGYNPETGSELWRLGGSSKITAPTPVVWEELIIVANGYVPEKPIFAIRAGALGDISLAEGRRSNQSVKWSKMRRGPYMSTPLAYQGRLYCVSSQGIFDSYDVVTGEPIYRKRIPHRGGGFSASPVAGDGKIYLPSEDGDVFVVKAGDEFELIATNGMGELLMATPAISEGAIYIRGQHHLFAIR